MFYCCVVALREIDGQSNCSMRVELLFDGTVMLCELKLVTHTRWIRETIVFALCM